MVRGTASVDRQFASALAHHHAGNLAAAEQGYRALLQQSPRHAGAMHLLGVLAHQSDRNDEAVNLITAAIKVDPRAAEPHANLGLALHALGRVADAAAAYRTALQRREAFPEAHNSLASALQDSGDFAGAIAHYRRAIELAPDYAPPRANLASALLATDDLTGAETVLRDALTLWPDDPACLSVLGVVLTRAGQSADAGRVLEMARRHDPADPEILVNLALLAERTADVVLAEATYREALALDPDHPIARWNLALLLLASGRIDEGWQHYEARLESRRIVGSRHDSIPRWKGDDLAGQHLLVWREQGLGDELLHSTLLPDLIRRSTAQDMRLSVECDPRLVSLFQRSYPEIRFVPDGTVGEGTSGAPDLGVASASLAGYLRKNLASFSGGMERPLVADPTLQQLWQDRLAALPGDALTIGICWRSGLATGERRYGYTSITDWLPLFQLPGVRFVLLQYDATEEELAAAADQGVELHRWDDVDLKNDQDKVAALMTELDLVISAGTAVSELAGALNIPVWRFGLPNEWTRLGTGVRPWFPSMRIFTPKPGKPMSDVPGQMADELRALARPASITKPPAEQNFAGQVASLYQQAMALRAAGDLAGAGLVCRQAIDLAGDAADPALLGLSGALDVALGHGGRAVPVLRRALALQPLWPGLHINLARALGQIASGQAAVSWRNALILDPAQGDGWAALADMGADPDIRVRLARRAISLRGDDYRLLGPLARALGDAGDPDRAGWCWWLMLVIDPACAEAFAGLANLRQMQGRDAASKKALARASALMGR